MRQDTFFLQVMQDVAESAEASEAIKADWVATVLKYLGVKFRRRYKCTKAA